MIALTDATVQAATGTKDATTGVDALKAALAGGGEEGAVTTGVFDAATQSVTQLTTKTGELSQSLTGVTSQLAGTGAEGALTTGMFGTANAAATGLDATTKTLASDLTGLTNQLSGAGSEGLATSNVFTATDGTATSLQSSVSFMSGSISTSAAQFAAATQQANAYAASLQRVNSAARQTGGGAPRMADGGTVQQGFAIVNERGSEIANIPGVGMMLMTQPGPVLGAFPKGTEIIPHGRSMELLSRFPGIPRMATGGTVGAMVAPVINITITGNTIANNVDIKNIAKQVSAEISRNYNARR